METNEQEAVEAPIKEGMGIHTVPDDYQPAPSRYVRMEEGNEGSSDKEEDLEAPYLALRPAPSPSIPQNKE